MIRIKEAIIVEGKYDKIKLSQIVDAVIISVNGFNIFRDEGMQKMVRKLADSTGIIVLTDSDRAGFLIRNFICGITDNKNVKHAYVPQIEGVEKRKDTASKDGFLGVEGISDNIIEDAIKKAATEQKEKKVYITKADFMRLGLSGSHDSKAKRERILAKMGLPTGISANSLMDILNFTCNEDEINGIIKEVL